MLVSLPVGLFAWTFSADLIYLTTGMVHQWYTIAFWSGIAAMISALVAALPGFGDYLTIARRSDAFRIATVHMLLNITVLALFFSAAMLMLKNHATTGGTLAAMVSLHGVALGLLGASGWLGGEMVYRHRLAVMPSAPAAPAPGQTGYQEFRPGLHQR